MKITSTTDLEFPGLKFSIRQGEVKELPADPEAAAFILASVYLPFAHFGSSFPRIGSLVLRNKELPMVFLSHCGQLPI